MIKSLGVSGILKIDNKVLVMRRLASETEPGYWEFPKGKVEENESLGEAIVREYAEETGLKVEVKEKLGVWVWGYKRDGQQYEVTETAFEVVLAVGESIDSLVLSEHDEWGLLSKATVANLKPMVEQRRSLLIKSLR